MKPFTVAVAQSISIAGDVNANIVRHLAFMQAAATRGAQLLIFPELSLTGYERTLARKLAIHADDPVLNPLRNLAQQLAMVTVVGMPLIDVGVHVDADAHIDTHPIIPLPVFIGALVLGADRSLLVHTKQHLHAGEDAVFTAGDGGAVLDVAGYRVALAICADYTHASHAAHAAHQGAGIYAAGALLTVNGYGAETTQLAGYAHGHAMMVMLANHGGPTGGWEPVGRSAIWAEDGRQVAVAPGLGDMLVLATHHPDGWSGSVVALAT